MTFLNVYRLFLKVLVMLVSEQVFVTCFADVQPDPSKSPSGARQRMNKDVLLPCLQAANANVSNDLLDEVMDCYRPEGPINR